MLSLTSEHALRALASLAESSNADPVLARDLSEEVEVPLRYLSKILGVLTKAGILHASRGPKGGYRLDRAAGQIPLIDVVELFDGASVRPSCLFGFGRDCSDESPCTAHDSWKGIRRGYIEFLESTTICDIGGRNRGR